MPVETDQELNERLKILNSHQIKIYNSTFDENIDSAAENFSIYQTKLGTGKFKYVPHCCWFYYMRIDTNGKLFVEHYQYPEFAPPAATPNWPQIQPSELPKIIEGLVKNARPTGSGQNPKKLPDNNFRNMKWSRKSYIIFFLDEENWEIHKDGSGHPAILVNENNGNLNRTFFDAKDVAVNIDGTTRSAVYMINHMKSKNSDDDIGYDKLDYKLDIYVRAKFAIDDLEGKRLTVIFDPPGGNEGPPGTP